MKGPHFRDRYDVVVIGAGVGGTTAAALLARSGLSVCVLEMDARPGGYLAGFRRKDFRFDSAIHWLNQMGPKGLVTRTFDLIGADHPTAAPQTRIKRYKSATYDHLLTRDPDALKRQWIAEFPEDAAGIERFFRDARRLGKAFDRMGTFYRSEETMGLVERSLHLFRKLSFAKAFIPHLRFSGEDGVERGLRRYFSNERLRKVFPSEMDLLSCLVPIGWAYYGDYQLPPAGGSQVVPEWLCHVIERMGGEVHFQCRVGSVLLQEGRAAGVRCSWKGREQEIRADVVISACDVKTLYERMLPDAAVPGKLKEQLEGADLYPSSVTVSLALDRPAQELGFSEEMIYLVDEELPRSAQSSGDPWTSGISILAPSLRDDTLSPGHMGTLTLYIPAEFSDHDHWKCERGPDGELIRGDAYKALKAEYADVLIKRVEQAIAPGLSDHILYRDVATPITHWRYTGNRNGSMMGARPGERNFRSGIAHYRTPVRGLFLGGHWAELGGGVPIAVRAGTNSALLALQYKGHRAAKPLARYMDGELNIQETRRQAGFEPYAEDWVRTPTPAEKLKARKAS
ncbi:MAG: NAD(P)/FAD-dependent oxidoreductase [Flavobacteriales bacterium]|nr:NAD(P)/FAD-dependent oxidoreductase [Flavobacteriales bacterium]